MGGAWIANSVNLLSTVLAQSDWITESPEAHVLPHIQHACAAPNAVWQLKRALNKDGIFQIDLVWIRDSGSISELRSDMYALIGGFAEPISFIRQRVLEGGLEFHIATGFLGTDTAYQEHGHLVQIFVTARRMSEILKGMTR